MASAEVPQGNGDGEKYGGYYGNQWRVSRRDGSAQQADAGIKRGEAEGDNPAQEKLPGNFTTACAVCPS